MPNGISLHIGVDHYSRDAYKKHRLSALPNCKTDAKRTMQFAKSRNFNSAILLDDEATLKCVLNGLKAVAAVLDYGDIFLMSFSGHGTRTRDVSADEDDGYDEAWCLYDGIISDDTLFEHLKLFRPGVRVVVIADCCHSGTSFKNPEEERSVSYDRNAARQTDDLQATCLLLAACQDNQVAHAGVNIDTSLYTYWLLKELQDPVFCESYRDLHKRLIKRMPKGSQPNLFKLGPGADQLERQRPFKI